MSDGVIGFMMDENDQPLIDVDLAVPDPRKGDIAASQRTLKMVSERYGGVDFAGLTEGQAQALISYASYGHHFGRSVFLRNPYKAKDLLGRMIAGHVSQNERLGRSIEKWRDDNFDNQVEQPDITVLPGFKKIYAWAEGKVAEFALEGWVVRMEPMTRS